MHPSRRRFLAAAATAPVAGCLGGSEDVVRLESLAVAGSPGGTVPVREPGTPSLVDFFATWCAPCVPQMETLGGVRSSFGPDELHLASVTTERDEAAVREFWRHHEGEWPVLLDPDLAATQAFDVTGIPTLVLLDGDGETQWRHRGLAGEDRLLAAVSEAVDG